MLSLKNGKLNRKELLDEIKKIDPANDASYNTLDDLSFAKLFADIFSGIAKYNVTSKSWVTYNGIVWENDVESMRIENYAKQFTRALQIYCADINSTDYIKYVAKLGDRRKRVIMLQDARDFTYCSQTDFDKDPDIFNCLNYAINLRTFERIEHDPCLMLSKVSNVFYDSEKTSPDFESFMKEIMKNDDSKIGYLQKVLGYTLIGTNTHEQCYFLYGSTTRNGKGTLCSTMTYLFGDYGANIQPETLATRDRNSRSASGDIARLDGVRFLNCSEPPKRMKLDVALLKTLTGRDPITARQLYEREFEYIPCFRLFMNCNYLPIVSDETLFSSDRVVVISFDRHFEESERDVNLKKKLQAKDNISGIFNWLLIGLQKYIEDGETLTVPEAIKKSTEEYRTKSDKIQNFILDCLIKNKSSCITAKEAYQTFVSWCKNNGCFAENKSNFLDLLRSKDLLSDSGTVNGTTMHNVIKGYSIESIDELPF